MVTPMLCLPTVLVTVILFCLTCLQSCNSHYTYHVRAFTPTTNVRRTIHHNDNDNYQYTGSRSRTPQNNVILYYNRLHSTKHGQRDVVAVSESNIETTGTTKETIGTQLQPLNPAVYTIQPSKTVAIFSLVKQMEASMGIKVTSLCVGEPDYSPPPSVIQSMIASMTTNATTINQATKYTAVSGLLPLRQAIANDLQTRKHVRYNPNTDILISNGAKQSVYQAIWAMAGVDDVVLIPSPYWPSYPEEVRLTGAIPIIVPTTIDNGYRLTPSQLEESLLIHSQTAKVLILCNPCNPTGTVYSEQELLELCTVLDRYPNVTIIADEIYERLVYTDGPTHVSFASLPNMVHRTITINGFSKSHAMTGLRIGYSCAPSHITTAMTTLQSQLTSCANAITQYAAIEALQSTPESWMDHVIVTMQQKRDYVMERLRQIPFVILSNEYPPTGAFYILPDIRMYCRTSRSNDTTTTTAAADDEYDDVTFCLQLLEQEQLAIVPGSSFGCPGTIRLSYATSMEELEIAMNKLERYCTTLRTTTIRPQEFVS